MLAARLPMERRAGDPLRVMVDRCSRMPGGLPLIRERGERCAAEHQRRRDRERECATRPMTGPERSDVLIEPHTLTDDRPRRVGVDRRDQELLQQRLDVGDVLTLSRERADVRGRCLALAHGASFKTSRSTRSARHRFVLTAEGVVSIAAATSSFVRPAR